MSEAVFYPSLSTLISLDDIPLLNNLSETVLEEIFYKDVPFPKNRTMSN